jgi:hypothetical protein
MERERARARARVTANLDIRKHILYSTYNRFLCNTIGNS